MLCKTVNIIVNIDTTIKSNLNLKLFINNDLQIPEGHNYIQDPNIVKSNLLFKQPK